MISIRPAVENDKEAICSVDLIAQRENERREFIRRAVNSGECFVAVADEKVIGYAVFNYSKFRKFFFARESTRMKNEFTKRLFVCRQKEKYSRSFAD